MSTPTAALLAEAWPFDFPMPDLTERSLPKPRRAAIYARLSKGDKDEVTGFFKTLKIEDQVARCRQWAKEHGWEIAEFIPEPGNVAAKRRNGKGPLPETPKPDTPGVYVDNDVSATKARPRPMYEVLKEDARQGRIDGIISVDADRLSRKDQDTLDLIKMFDEHKVQTAYVQAGLVDLSTAIGRFIAKLMAILAVLEGEQKAERQKRANQARTMSGIAYGGLSGNRRAFGWEDGGMELRKAEADALADAIDQILKGANLRPIVDKWNREGLKTARGGTWTLNTIKQVMTRWRNANIVHIVQEVDGKTVQVPAAPGNWDPIVSTETLRAIRDHFDARGQGKNRLLARTYLCSNIATCGRCGSTLRHGRSRHKDGSIVDAYRCNNYGGGGSCGTGISQHILDKKVTDFVVARLAAPTARTLSKTAEDQANVDALRARRTELQSNIAEVRAMKSLSTVQRGKLMAEDEAEIAEIETELARLRSRDAVGSVIMDLGTVTVQEEWAGGDFMAARRRLVAERFKALGSEDVGPQRAVIKQECFSIVVQPHPKGEKPTPESARRRIEIVGMNDPEDLPADIPTIDDDGVRADEFEVVTA